MDAGGDAQSDAAADDAGGIDAARRDGGPDSGPPSCTPKELSMVIPRVVWNGAELAVVTGDMGEGRDPVTCRDVTWRRLSPDGAELPPTTTLRTGPGDLFVDADVAWTGSSYGVVWTDGVDEASRSVFRPVSPDGAPLGDAIDVAEAGPSFAPRIAWAGGAFAIVWSDARTGSAVIRFRRFDAAGAPVGPELELTPGIELAWPVVLAPDGDGLALVWQVDGKATGGPEAELRLSRLTSGGERRALDFILTSHAYSIWPADVVSIGPALAVAYAELDPEASRIRLQLSRVDADGWRRETTLTSSSAGVGEPSVAFSGSEIAVAWHELDEETSDVVVQRVSTEGALIGAPTRFPDRYLPALAWVGDGYLLVQGFLGLRPVHIP